MPDFPPGTPCWVDLASPDPAASAAFYRDVLGWQATEPDPDTGNYQRFEVDGKAVAGLMPLMQEGQPTGWNAYVSVADVDGTAQKVESAGGSSIMGATDVLDLGRMAFFTDPTGAAFGVWQPGTFAGAELVDAPGGLCWVELQTRDPEAGKAFYSQVFGWHAGRPPFEGAPASYVVWERDGEQVAGMMEMSDEFFGPEVPPHWGVCFEVADCDGTVAKARDKGGTVTMEPTDMAPLGRFAGVLDPQGAAFAILETPSDG